MALKHYPVSLSTTAASLVPARVSGAGSSELDTVFASLLFVAKVDTYVGGPGVTAANYGVKVPAGSTFSLDLKPGDVPYAALASGTSSQPVLLSGVA